MNLTPHNHKEDKHYIKMMKIRNYSHKILIPKFAPYRKKILTLI